MQKGSWTITDNREFIDHSLVDSSLPCFAAFGDQTANQLRERFQPALTHSLVGEYVDRLIDSSLGSNWTRLYDSVSIHTLLERLVYKEVLIDSFNTIPNRFSELRQ